jgi:hypothetical protein
MLIAVGTQVTLRPPAQIRTGPIKASGSHLGWCRQSEHWATDEGSWVSGESRWRAKNASRSRSTLMWWRSAVSFSFLLSLAAFRTRSSACDTRSRPCVRCVLCSLAFPLAPDLCSTGSAAAETGVASALFVGFPAPIAGSDFSRSCIVGYGSSPSRRGPAAIDRAVERELSRFPEIRSFCICQVLRPRRGI